MILINILASIGIWSGFALLESIFLPGRGLWPEFFEPSLMHLLTRIIFILGSVLFTVSYMMLRRQSRALARRREHLERAQNLIKVGTWERDLSQGHIDAGGLLNWSKELRAMWGVGDAQFTYPKFLNIVHPEDREIVSKAASRAASKGGLIEFDFRVFRPDGSLIYNHAIAEVKCDSRGRPFRIFGTAQDVTERKKTEENLESTRERLLLATRAAGIGIWEWNIATNELLWDERMCELYDVDTKVLIHAYDEWASRVHPDDLAREEQVLRSSFTSDRGYSTEFRIVRPDGSIRHIHASGYIRRDSTGRPVRVFGTNRDITDRKKLEQELNDAIDMRDDFISIASHELKTPLTAVRLQLLLLSRRIALLSSSEKVQATSRAALGAVDRLDRLLEQLLDITRIRAGRLTLRREQTDLQTIVVDCTTALKEEAKALGSCIRLQGADSVIGNWDAARIHQVVLNLLSNAIKYGAGLPIEITVSSMNSRVARLQVKDSGIGITEEMQQKVFERFQRATSQNHVSGLGLGLYIARQIVELHGGNIKVESELGKGSIFIVELPIAKPGINSNYLMRLSEVNRT
jgi:PAS domain S-box-containing protein